METFSSPSIKKSHVIITHKVDTCDPFWKTRTLFIWITLYSTQKEQAHFFCKACVSFRVILSYLTSVLLFAPSALCCLCVPFPNYHYYYHCIINAECLKPSRHFSLSHLIHVASLFSTRACVLVCVLSSTSQGSKIFTFFSQMVQFPCSLGRQSMKGQLEA